MNIVQEIIIAMFKASYFNFFEGSCTSREENFIKKMLASRYSNHLKVEKSDKFLILVWNSSSLGETLACRVSDSGFYFSSLEIYSREKKAIERPISDHIISIPDKKLLEEEIEEIKTLFMLFSIDAKVYFK